MKKILLIVVAIMMAGVMSAQPFQSNKNNKVLPAKPMPAMMQAKVNRDIKAAPQEYRRMSTKPLDFGKKLSVSQKAKAQVTSKAAKAAPRRAAALLESYNAVGTDYSTKEQKMWTMSIGTLEGSEDPCLVNVLPVPTDIFPDQESIAVPYTLSEDGKLVIKPTVVGQIEGKEGTEYIILFSAVDEEGCIRMTVAEDGKITIGEFKAFAKNHDLEVSLLELPNIIKKAKQLGMLK